MSYDRRVGAANTRINSVLTVSHRPKNKVGVLTSLSSTAKDLQRFYNNKSLDKVIT